MENLILNFAPGEDVTYYLCLLEILETLPANSVHHDTISKLITKFEIAYPKLKRLKK